MTHQEWENLLNRVGAVLNFGIEKKDQVKNSKMAKLIAATPFLAGCNKKLETSFSHLLIYLMSLDESAKNIYFHKPEDDEDIYSRLYPISNFSGGKKEIIQCCMDLKALCMISNYNKDSVNDKTIGKYNPINDSNWNFEVMSAPLIQSIDNRITKEISEIYSKEDALEAYWDN